MTLKVKISAPVLIVELNNMITYSQKFAESGGERCKMIGGKKLF
jgi:hypothetical protein